MDEFYGHFAATDKQRPFDSYRELPEARQTGGRILLNKLKISTKRSVA